MRDVRDMRDSLGRVRTMSRPVNLRAWLEDNGATLAVVNGELHADAPEGLLTPRVHSAIAAHRHALLTHLRLFPCRGCGRSPLSGVCARCPHAGQSSRVPTGDAA